MTNATKRIGLAVAVMGLLAGSAGRANAGLVLISSSGDNYRYGQVSDFATGGSDSYDSHPSNNDGSTSVSKGTSSASSSNSMSFTASSTTVGIATSTSATASNSDASSHANSVGHVYQYLNFLADADGTYNVVGYVDYTFSNTGEPYFYVQYGKVGLYDFTEGHKIYDNKYSATYGVEQGGSLPSQVTLTAGHSYQLSAHSFSQAMIGAGSSTGTATANLTLTEVSPVPEPSTIALAFTALPIGLGFVWKRRRKALTV